MKTKAIICDIDGTLANINHRRHFVDYNFVKNKCGSFDLYYCSQSINWEESDKYLNGKSGFLYKDTNKQWKPDWNAFNAAMIHDTPNEWCVDLLVQCWWGLEILFVTARKEKFRLLTSFQIGQWIYKWEGDFDMYKTLEHPNVLFENLFMRPDDDFRPDVEIKREIYEKHIRDNYDVLFCLDENAEIVELWRSLGLVCLDCAGYRR